MLNIKHQVIYVCHLDEIFLYFATSIWQDLSLSSTLLFISIITKAEVPLYSHFHDSVFHLQGLFIFIFPNSTYKTPTNTTYQLLAFAVFLMDSSVRQELCFPFSCIHNVYTPLQINFSSSLSTLKQIPFSTQDILRLSLTSLDWKLHISFLDVSVYSRVV